MQRHASGCLAFMSSQQQQAMGRGIVSRQLSEFFIETLEAQAETEGPGVFHEELADAGDLLR